MNELDERIRAGLAGAAGSPPSAPPFADVEARARRLGRHRRALAGAAALATAAVAVGVIVAQPDGDGDGHTVVVTEPEAPTSTTTAPDATTTTADATSTTVAATPAAPRPERVLVATADGRLLVLDVGSGATAIDLGRFDVDLDPPEGSPFGVDDVAITPDGARAFVSRCCEPAAGWIAALPADGSATLDLDGDEQHFATATRVQPAPAGLPWLAISVHDGIAITSGGPPTGPADVPAAPGDLVSGLAWSADGTRLTWQEHLAGNLVVAEVGPDGDARVLGRFAPPPGTSWREPVFRTDGAIVVLESASDEPATLARVLDGGTGDALATFELPGPTVRIGYDASGTWLLVLLDDGRLFGMGGGEVFRIPVDGAVAAADW